MTAPTGVFEQDVMGLCDECARVEIRKAAACHDREKAAKAKGQSFACTCEDTICTHGSPVSRGTSG